MVLLLAQDFQATPLERYFPYIVLGLVMCFGYIALRMFGRQRHADDEWDGPEEMLRQAEREARERAAARRMGQDEEPDESGLAPSAEDEELRARLEKQGVRQGSDAPGEQPPAPPAEDKQP